VYLLSGVDGIGKHNKQDIDCEFTDNSFDLRILHFNGKNWRLRIGPLNGLIDPASCKIKVKSNSITLELKKAKSKYWSDIKESAALASAPGAPTKKGSEDGADPSASLMNMMKDLYEKGDDQMKKTIAESWTKSQQERAMGKQ
jgi:calcyclin binding protein